tara:strand:+ start:2643 stop:3905 length:1263 start_codon:yes stop_codon:yes gene_type:complete
MNRILLFAFLTFVFHSASAQKDRYRFAATYFGFESELNLEHNKFSVLDNQGNIEEHKLPSSISPRFLIGGTHFWNRADFYISFPLANFRLDGNKKASISNDVLTGFRVIPFQLKQNRVRPFLGVGFNSKEYRQNGGNGESQLYTNWQWFFEGGLVYTHKNRKLIGLELRYFPNNTYDAYYDRNNFQEVEVSPFSVSISYKKLFDFSAGYSKESTKQFYAKMKNQLEKEGKLNTFSIGIGLSALIPLEKTEHASRKKFLNEEVEGAIHPEVGIGFYHHKLDGYLRVSYRPLKQEEQAYNYNYQLNKHSIALEAFKFIGDYHGFVPFVGPSISQDFYRLNETDYGQKITELRESHIGYGLVFGWDIRFTESDHIILRTNLRYTPNFNYKTEGFNYTSKGLEFNFIQLVYYPQRHKIFKQLNK